MKTRNWFFILVIITVLLAVGGGVAGDMHYKDSAAALATAASTLGTLLALWFLFGDALDG